MSDVNPIEQLQSTFIQLEHEARHADSREALSFIMANSTKKLLPFHQAVFWRKTRINRVRIETVSGTGLINRDAPYLLWLQKVLTLIGRSKRALELHQVNRDGFRKDLVEQWDEWCPPYVLWCPLVSPDQHLMGGLWLTRDTPWTDGELTILQELLDAYSHAWHSLTVEHSAGWFERLQPYNNRRTLVTAGAVLFAILLFPVRQTVLAPAEIVSQDPKLISAPQEGVVAEIYVEPNERVERQQKLFTLDQTKFLNQYRVAEKSLKVAQEKYRKAGQDAFSSDESKSELAVLAAEVEKNRAQMDYAKSVLDDITIRSPTDGVAIFGSQQDWIGKPVVIGQKVMLVANPAQKALDVWLPVSDAIGINPGSQVKLFLNVAPLSPVTATVKYVSYEASERPDGTLAYAVRAEFSEADIPRIGLQGTAKLYGDRVVLVYYLLWRPLSAMRRFIGV